MGFFFMVSLMAIATLLCKFLMWWLSNRPEKVPIYTEQEIRLEMEKSYVSLECIGIEMSFEYVPVLLSELRDKISHGLSIKQESSLISRIENQGLLEIRNACFPISINDQASDLHIQWVSLPNDKCQIIFRAVPEVVDLVQEYSKTVPTKEINLI